VRKGKNGPPALYLIGGEGAFSEGKRKEEEQTVAGKNAFAVDRVGGGGGGRKRHICPWGRVCLYLLLKKNSVRG